MNSQNIIKFFKKFLNHPLGRGMLSYGITFPTACCIQEFHDKKKLHDINWKRCVRFSLYGIFVTSPLFYCWIRISNKIWRKQTLSSGLQKALVEQVTYGPIAMSLFFFNMAYFESGSFDTARKELKNKFWHAFKVSVCYWSVVQTLNFTFVTDRNRLVFASVCSLLWTTFLTYVDKHGSPFESDIVQSKTDE